MILKCSASLRLGEESKPADIQMLRLSLNHLSGPDSRPETGGGGRGINPEKEGEMEAHCTNNKNDFTPAEVS